MIDLRLDAPCCSYLKDLIEKQDEETEETCESELRHLYTAEKRLQDVYKILKDHLDVVHWIEKNVELQYGMCEPIVEKIIKVFNKHYTEYEQDPNLIPPSFSKKHINE